MRVKNFMKLTLIARTYKNVLEGELYARTSNSMKVLCSIGIPSFSVSTWVLNKNVSNLKRWSFLIKRYNAWRNSFPSIHEFSENNHANVTHIMLLNNAEDKNEVSVNSWRRHDVINSQQTRALKTQIASNYTNQVSQFPDILHLQATRSR